MQREKRNTVEELREDPQKFFYSLWINKSGSGGLNPLTTMQIVIFSSHEKTGEKNINH